MSTTTKVRVSYQCFVAAKRTIPVTTPKIPKIESSGNESSALDFAGGTGAVGASVLKILSLSSSKDPFLKCMVAKTSSIITPRNSQNTQKKKEAERMLSHWLKS